MPMSTHDLSPMRSGSKALSRNHCREKQVIVFLIQTLPPSLLSLFVSNDSVVSFLHLLALSAHHCAL